MPKPLIQKELKLLKKNPNLRSLEEEVQNFSWEKAKAELQTLPGNNGINIAYEAVDRHVYGKQANKVAIRILRKEGNTENFTYLDLFRATNRFANLLQALGVQPGETVFALLGRIPELYITALGTLKNRSVFCPLFSAFGPEPIQTRLTLGEGKVLVTTEGFYQKKIAPIRANLPQLKHILLIGGGKRAQYQFVGEMDGRKLS